MDQVTRAIEQLRRAIEDEGTHPEYHREQLARLRREWPTLAAAIDAVLAATAR